MSYILDALKKNERERGVARVPTLMTVHEYQETRRRRTWIIAGVLLLCGAAAAWFLLPSLRTIVRPGEPSRASIEPGRIASPPDAAPAQTSIAANPAPAAVAVSGEKASPGPIDDLRPLPGTIPSKAATRESPARERGIKPSAKTAEVSKQNGRNPAIPYVSGKAAPPAEQDADEDDLSAENASPEPGAAQAKPATLREAIKGMTISVLVYDESKAERLVFINGRKYVEGDYVEGDYLLESITQDGAVLSHEGERILLQLGAK